MNTDESILPAVLSNCIFKQLSLACFNPSADLFSPRVPDRRQHKLSRNQISHPFDGVSRGLVMTPHCGSQLLGNEGEVGNTGEQARFNRRRFTASSIEKTFRCLVRLLILQFGSVMAYR